MAAIVPLTPLADYFYARLHARRNEPEKPGEQAVRLAEADRLLANPDLLVELFHRSVEQADLYFAADDRSGEPFYEKRRPLDREPGLDSTAALARSLEDNRGRRWQVLGDDSLSFHYVDRELVSTRAPGARLAVADAAGGRSTRLGPRLDLLLANASDGTPVVAEVKVTVHNAPDKDPFFALIQALASAAYLAPPNQLSRLRHHDPDGRLNLSSGRLDVYLVIAGEPERARYWFELRDRALRLAAAIQPGLDDHVRRIVAVDLHWLPSRPPATRLQVTKRFSASD